MLLQLMDNPKKFIFAVKRSTMLRALFQSMRKTNFVQNMWLTDNVIVDLINDVLNYKDERNSVTCAQWNKFIGREMTKCTVLCTAMIVCIHSTVFIFERSFCCD